MNVPSGIGVITIGHWSSVLGHRYCQRVVLSIGSTVVVVILTVKTCGRGLGRQFP